MIFTDGFLWNAAGTALHGLQAVSQVELQHRLIPASSEISCVLGFSMFC
jgi:hypothetical protein